MAILVCENCGRRFSDSTKYWTSNGRDFCCEACVDEFNHKQEMRKEEIKASWHTCAYCGEKIDPNDGWLETFQNGKWYHGKCWEDVKNTCTCKNCGKKYIQDPVNGIFDDFCSSECRKEYTKKQEEEAAAKEKAEKERQARIEEERRQAELEGREYKESTLGNGKLELSDVTEAAGMIGNKIGEKISQAKEARDGSDDSSEA